MARPKKVDTTFAILPNANMKHGKNSAMNQQLKIEMKEGRHGAARTWLATLAIVSITGLAQAATVEQMLPSGVDLKTASAAQLREASKQATATDSTASSVNISEALKKRHDLASTKAIVDGGLEGVKLRYASTTTGMNSDGKSLSDGKGKGAVMSECPEIQQLVASAVRTVPAYTQQILDLSIKSAPDCVLPAVAEGYSDSGVLERHFDFSLLGRSNPANTKVTTAVENPVIPIAPPEPDPTVTF